MGAGSFAETDVVRSADVSDLSKRVSGVEVKRENEETYRSAVLRVLGKVNALGRTVHDVATVAEASVAS